MPPLIPLTGDAALLSGSPADPAKEVSEHVPRENPSSPTVPVPARPKQINGSEAAGRALIKFNLSAPAPGAFPLYDQAAAAMGHRRALPALVARAFEALEADLAAGRSVAHQEYPIESGGHRASSSRTMDASLLAQARRALDPFELLTPSAFGSLLAKTALARLLIGWGPADPRDDECSPFGG